MTLLQQIKAMPGYAESTSDSDVDLYLQTPVTVPNTAPVTTKTLMAKLTVAETRMVLETLKAASAGDVLIEEGFAQLKTEGLDFSHANTVEVMTALFSKDADLLIRLLALGTKQVIPWSTVMPNMDEYSRLSHINIARKG